jgi:hypothetical protein
MNAFIGFEDSCKTEVKTGTVDVERCEQCLL